jgi:hypothetical protein
MRNVSNISIMNVGIEKVPGDFGVGLALFTDSSTVVSKGRGMGSLGETSGLQGPGQLLVQHPGAPYTTPSLTYPQNWS